MVDVLWKLFEVDFFPRTLIFILSKKFNEIEKYIFLKVDYRRYLNHDEGFCSKLILNLKSI